MNIRQVRKKIKSIGNVKKITKAMQMVSAVKMKKAQQEALEGKPFRTALQEMMDRITSKIDIKQSPLLEERDAEKSLVILVTSNKGLCGAFNFNLLQFFIRTVKMQSADYVSVGKKGSMLLGRLGGTILADFSSNKPASGVSAIFSFAVEKFLSGTYNKVHIVYNKFISAMKYEPTMETILPVTYTTKLGGIEIKEEYTMEPSVELILEDVLRTFVEEKVRGAILSNEAGEHSARMMAMKNATDNATDLMEEFTLLRNKLRQEKITYELLDMITAKESVGAS